MAAQQAFVSPAGGDWVVKASGNTVSGPHSTQDAAVDAGRTWLLGNGGGELVIQGEDGRIRDKHTIGRDDPRGTKG